MVSSETHAARMMMVDSQVRPNKVTDPAIIAAMRTLPREDFLPPSLAARAYADESIRLGDDRVMLEPMVTARMVQLAAIAAGENVLVAASGGGYAAALIARLGAVVTALEESASLAAIAAVALARHAPSVSLVSGPIGEGWPNSAPYDLILVDGAVEDVPTAYAAQLRPDGRIVMVRAVSAKLGHAMIGRLSQGVLSFTAAFDCAASPLPMLRRKPAFVF